MNDEFSEIIRRPKRIIAERQRRQDKEQGIAYTTKETMEQRPDPYAKPKPNTIDTILPKNRTEE